MNFSEVLKRPWNTFQGAGGWVFGYWVKKGKPGKTRFGQKNFDLGGRTWKKNWFGWGSSEESCGTGV